MTKWLCILCVCPWAMCGAASIRLFSGETYEGRAAIENRGISITPHEAEPVRISPADIIEANFGAHAHKPDIVAPGIVLTSGSNIAGKVESLDELKLKLGQIEISVPEPAIAAVVFLASPRKEVLKRTETGGLLANGDFFAGTFGGMKKGAVIINSPLFGPQRLPTGHRLIVLVLQNVTLHPALYEIATKNGSRFLVDELRIEEQGLLLREPLLGQIRIPGGDVVRIRAGGGRYQPLTELEPVRVDAAAGGNPDDAVKVEPEAADGSSQPILVTAANAAVTYAVSPGMPTFSCIVTLAQDTPADTKVTFAVYGDGRLLFRTPPREPGSAPAPVKVALGNTRHITLRVEPASPGSNTASGQWIGPAFMRR